MKDLMTRFWADDSGQGLTEYALIIALVSIGLFVALGLFRESIENVFTAITDRLNDLPGPGAGDG